MSGLSKRTDADFDDLTVVVPVFNEETGVVPALRELRGAARVATMFVIDRLPAI